ncbi:hypothetical protein P7K49_009392, partial [Saguinus oedipus]
WHSSCGLAGICCPNRQRKKESSPPENGLAGFANVHMPPLEWRGQGCFRDQYLQAARGSWEGRGSQG